MQTPIPTTSSTPTSPPTERASAATGRIVALDAARGLAVLGMFAVHLGPPTDTPGASWLSIFEGRSAALFAVLAGISLALLSGGAHPATGAAAAASVRRIVIRALAIGALGVLLAALGTPIMVILTYYGVYFLLAIPLLRARWQTLAVLAAAWAVAGPVISFLIRRASDITDSGGAPVPQQLTSWTGLEQAFVQLFLTGGYPVLSWMPFVFAGMALGRMDLRRIRAGWLAATGGALAVLGYGGSWIAMHLLGGHAALTDLLQSIFAEIGEPATQEQIDMLIGAPGMGTAPATSWWWLAGTNAHTGTPFEIIGAIGVAFTVIGVLIALTGAAAAARSRLATKALSPLIAVGTCALSVYTLHVIGARIAFAALLAGEQPTSQLGQPSWQLLGVFVAAAFVGTMAWLAFFRRGPLEWVLHRLSTVATRPEVGTTKA